MVSATSLADNRFNGIPGSGAGVVLDAGLLVEDVSAATVSGDEHRFLHCTASVIADHSCSRSVGLSNWGERHDDVCRGAKAVLACVSVGSCGGGERRDLHGVGDH
ncbi:MAG: hypothetical protein WBN99_08775 [Mycobacterium sp.]